MGWNTSLTHPIPVSRDKSAVLRTMADASHFLFEGKLPPCDCMAAARISVCEAVLTETPEDIQKATEAMEAALRCRPRPLA